MTIDPLDDNALDRAIDGVARELTSGAPCPGFDARVRASLERPRPWRAWRWQLAAAVAVIVIAIGPYLSTALRPIPQTTMPASGLATGPRASGARAPTPMVRATPERVPAVPGPDRVAPEPPRVARVVHPIVRIPIDDDEAPQIAALRPLSQLDLAPIQMTELTIPPLEAEKEPR